MEKDEQQVSLADEVGQAIGRAVDALVLVNREDGLGSYAQLQRSTGIARSTLRKLGKGGNPDLKTLCRLAGALDVPPALLLMTGEDWQAIISAAKSWHEAAALARGEDVAQRTGLQKIEVGVRILERLLPPLTLPTLDESAGMSTEVYRRRVQAADRNSAQRSRRARSATAIAQASAARPGDLEVLTAFAALFGAAR